MRVRSRLHGAAALDSVMRSIAEDAGHLEFKDLNQVMHWLRRKMKTHALSTTRVLYENGTVVTQAGEVRMITFTPLT